MATAALQVIAGGTTLPSPTELSTSDEIIWSANTGRSTDSGKMIGDIVAKKKTLDVQWSFITRSELETIRSAVNTSAFFNATLKFIPRTGSSTNIVSMECYRSEVTAEVAGIFGGVLYYRTAKVSLIQR